MDYNNTLNLPHTDFPMRAGLPQREPEFLKKWNEQHIYERLAEINQGKPLYILHDGPPFSNGNIHMGTAMNKILKDFIVRYKSLSGYQAPYIPGWDNHGMPIESAIIKKNKINRKKMSIPEFRDACRQFAENFVHIQMEQFKRLGILGDWDRPYLTMDPTFESVEVKVFGEMYKKGYIYKGLKPVYWCPHDETALAEAEIEYSDDPCTSIYVKFRLKDDCGKLSQYGSDIYFIIWTTTTWTLPGNRAIALNPDEDYVIAAAGNDRYIAAAALLDETMKAGGVTDYSVLATYKGAYFENMTAQHPFLDIDSLIVNADYVTMDSGTGCVHTAPAFGADDYVTGKKYGLDMTVPVDDRGYQTADAGKYEGLRYDESNNAILQDLRESGALFASKDITHQYPHCWRCKNPIIFRATPQWFCSVETFKDETIAAVKDVEWIPEWGEERISQMVRDRADWCISRQRHWGLPIPVFYCEECGKPICNDATIDKISRLFKEHGSNIWYEKDVEYLLPQDFVCPHCGGRHFSKETDTLDGWFDSGSTHFVVLRENPQGIWPQLSWPADCYLEGADQYRGWFQSSLLTSVGVTGKAPYKTVLTHGWVVDGQGKAMHKSLGNSIAPEEIIKKYGAEMLRLWVASSDYHADVRVSDDIFKQLSQAYLKIRNTARYMLGNLCDFDPNDLMPAKDMRDIDRWAVSRLNDLTERVVAAYDQYAYHIIYHAVRNFCVVDMSNFYLDTLKDTLYCDAKDGHDRRSAQTAMFLILDSLVRLLAPILAFTADEIWSAMPHRNSDNPENVMLNEINPPFTEYELSEQQMAEFDELAKIRDTVNVALENARTDKMIGKSLEAKVTIHCPGSQVQLLEKYENILKTIFIVSQVSVVPSQELSVQVEPAEGLKCERCWSYGQDVGQDDGHPTLCARCAAVVKQL